MDLATQEKAVRLLRQANELFAEANRNAGRLDAASPIVQWLEDYDAVQPQISGGA